MASASASNNERTSTSGTVAVKFDVRTLILFLKGSPTTEKNINLGLNFGPQWMRNPPQQEPFPQRTFPLAQYRYGREEMLAIFEQIGSV